MTCYDHCIILSLISCVKLHNLVEATFLRNVLSLVPYHSHSNILSMIKVSALHALWTLVKYSLPFINRSCLLCIISHLIMATLLTHSLNLLKVDKLIFVTGMVAFGILTKIRGGEMRYNVTLGAKVVKYYSKLGV